PASRSPRSTSPSSRGSARAWASSATAAPACTSHSPNDLAALGNAGTRRAARCPSIVIRRHVLAALAVGIKAGDEDAARPALAEADWIGRGTARRRLERALIDAELATLDNGTVTPVIASPGFAGARSNAERCGESIDEESSRHVQRIAALDIAGAPDVDATDRERVAA